MTVIPMQRLDLPSELPVPPGRWHRRLWVSDEPLREPETYRACVRAFALTGLWPVLIPPDPRFAATGEDWIDDRAAWPAADGRVAAVDVGATLAGWWGGPCCEGDCLYPFDREFPGLVRHVSLRRDPLAEAADMGALFGSLDGHRLGLVRVSRAADVPAAIGWMGAANFTERVEAISAVLRSWEDRFGARLVVLGFDELKLSVAAPPRTEPRALGTAAEHRAFCPENFSMQPGNMRTFARTLLDYPMWSFWWD
jgi:hypothetical protein